ncbi:MAG: PQQ-dependent sugar dehydrogenase [Gammaproteobacteria bacterium]
MRLPFLATWLMVLGILSCRPASAQSFWVEEVVTGLNVPWSMAWLPDGDMLITEKFGGLRVVRDGKLVPEPVAGVPATYRGSINGLLDIALDPDFATNQRVYLTYDEGTETRGHGVLYRARWDGRALVDGKVIYRTTLASGLAPHSGLTRLAFLPDKTLLVGVVVDDTRRFLAQRLNYDHGKILRLDRDGGAVADNPFAAQDGALPQVYSRGHRVITGLAHDPVSGAVWEVENGPQGGDELNVIRAGANYGWPDATYGIQYDGQTISTAPEQAGIDKPLAYWVPSIAPSGLAFVRGGRYPRWQEAILVGALSGRHLRLVHLRDGRPDAQETLLADLKERIRDVRVGPDGYIYLLTDNQHGRLLRLRPGMPPADAHARVARALPELTNPTTDTMDLKPKPVDADRGARLFAQQCAQCHATTPGAGTPAGPSLAGVVGARPATGSYPYSDELRNAALRWESPILERYLAGPDVFLHGSRMPGPAVRSAQDRADLIGYLQRCCAAP